MKQFLLLVFLLFCCSVSFTNAQNCPNRFRILNAATGQEDTVFCVGQRIRARDCTGLVDADKEYYDFNTQGTPSFTDTVKFNTYTQPGRYVVTQGVNQQGTFITFSRTIRVVASPAPKFKVTACTGNKATITITDTNYSSYSVNFGDGSTPRTLQRGATFIHTYSGSGSKNITVTGSYANGKCPGTADTTVSLLQTPATPALQALRVITEAANGELELELQQINPAFRYIVERASPGNPFTTVDTLTFTASGNVTATVSGIDTRTPLCYRVRPIDACNAIPFSIRTNTICSQKITAQAANKRNIISWNSYLSAPDLAAYNLYRDGNLLATVNTTRYEDTTAICGTNHCYRVEAALKDNSISASAQACVTTISTVPPVAGYLFSTFNAENQVELTLTVPPGESLKTMQVKRSFGSSSSFNNLTTVSQQTFTNDIFGDLSRQPCYKVTYRDNCDKQSPESNVSCPVLLQASLTDEGFGLLQWSAYRGFRNGVEKYEVELLDAFGNVEKTFAVTSGFQLIDNQLDPQMQVQVYRVKATAKVTGEVTYSNRAEVVQEFKIFFPNAFSPNNDGLNDVFEMKGRFLSNISFKIYDRWGQVVFQTESSSQGWDGTINGELAPVGAYAFQFIGYDAKGKKFERNGTVTLLR
ncbi:MAG: gliding motility-associated C-terminal domain-containing protein [Hymenobacteraceae bacterium]|nr:gliding motility-associated C-terminal domain-containing protein [Hymenobacteraceae bacterium]MDX5395134.1 gliding motility-associated C-terminal domain-containing protein [Hymenobacteraceae bacterium]MDX5511175.1 gliding motility-associated C-terminal domain-containing protein [Hymenobacteraceae bacterium]